MSRNSLDGLDGSRTPDVRSDTDNFPSDDADSIPGSLAVSDDVLYYVDETMPRVAISPIATADPASDVDLRSKATTALYHVLDFARITLVTQTLLSRWLHQLFLELERYDRAPSMEAQETWLGYPIIGIAASLSLMAKVVNGIYSKEKYLAAEDYVAAIFRSAHFYFILDLWAGAESMSLGAFIATSAIALPLLMAFFTKHALPDSDDRVYCCKADLDFISTLRISTGSNTERPFNFMEGLHYGMTGLVTPLWAINREIHGKTLALPVWQFGIIGAGMLCSAKVGYDLTDHPTRFQLLAMGSKFFRDGALAYAAASGILYMVCRDKPSCSDVGSRVALIMACWIIALSIGFYSAITTRFRFEENCEHIEKIITGIRNAPETIADGLASVGNNVSRFFTSCCKKEEVGSDLSVPSLA